MQNFMPAPINLDIGPTEILAEGVEASAFQANQNVMGNVLLNLGKITPEDIDNILATQQSKNIRFGEAAMRLGLITETDIRQVLAMQFEYPYLEPNQSAYNTKLLAAYKPFSPQVEALRALRSQLMMHWFNDGYKTLAIVSANLEEESNFLAANLAIVFAQLGKKTLLIDTNLRQPSQRDIFKLKQNLGLSDILSGRASLAVATQIDKFTNLSVLGAGTIPPNPLELLSRSNFNDLLKQVAEDYEVVLLDATPTTLTADAQITVASAGGALLVSKLNFTKISDLAMLKDQISLTGAGIVGAVINDL